MAATFLSAGGVFDSDSAMERLHAWKDGIDRKAADTQAMSEQLSALRVTLADTNGLAEVTVDSTGNLLDLTIGRPASRVAPEVLSRTIMTLVRDASAQLAARSQEIVAETMGTESAAARAISEHISQRLLRPTVADEAGER